MQKNLLGCPQIKISAYVDDIGITILGDNESEMDTKIQVKCTLKYRFCGHFYTCYVDTYR